MEYGLTERRTERKASKFTKSTYKYALALENVPFGFAGHESGC